MKCNLFAFQQKALDQLHKYCHYAHQGYQIKGTPQVISFTAPTGSGKTIIMSALIEQIFCGSEYIAEQSNAIIVWLSDSPELNNQSRDKIETKADRIQIGQCVTIEDNSFDQEMLDDGHIYFLNTQKLSKSSNLTSHGDSRQYTIWETLNNTIQAKYDHLYMIIDEAHRGAKMNQTTLMQTFLKGNEFCKPMPVVVGMSATSARFKTLVEGLSLTVDYVKVEPEEVRQSGLLKDLIEIYSPDDSLDNKVLGVLQAATDEWRDKWQHWYQYCKEQHYAYVNPIFIIQVEPAIGDKVSATELDECLNIIETRLGSKFMPGEVVHCFGEKGELEIYGLKVPYEEPSRIQDNRNIKLVFFKESLSTGWDCPRAETLMSFRHAIDKTYIAQLLGRMIRTPMQMRIQVDETLNNVHLYLPNFNIDTVSSIVDELQKAEGGEIPANFIEETVGGNKKMVVVSIKPKKTATDNSQTQAAIGESDSAGCQTTSQNTAQVTQNDADDSESADKTDGQTADQTNEQTPGSVSEPMPAYKSDSSTTDAESSKSGSPSQATTSASGVTVSPSTEDGFDREAVLNEINNYNLITYNVRTVRTYDYLRSLFNLSHLLSQTKIYCDAVNEVHKEISEKIHNYAEYLRKTGKYEEMAKKVLEIKLTKKGFDVTTGEAIEDSQLSMFTSSNADLERQFRLADARLYNEGICYRYGDFYAATDDEDSYRIEFILYVGSDDCMNGLDKYAEEKFCALYDKYRFEFAKLKQDTYRQQFDKIISDSNAVTEHVFRLPEDLIISASDDGDEYVDHLFVGNNGSIKLKLNEWEKATLEEERKRDGYICWLRNVQRKTWALSIPYTYNNEERAMYPDFMIFRREPDGSFRIAILEPHGGFFDDSLPKAKGMAKYAEKNPTVGRIQLIHVEKDKATSKNVCRRLDMSKLAVRKKVMLLNTNQDLNNLFITDGIVE